MSVLQTLRERAGALLAIVVGASLLLFVVGDFFGNGRGQRIRAKKYYELADIGGEQVSYQEFDQRIQNLIEIYKLSGTTNITEELSESLREQIWQQMLEEKVLGSEIAKLGIGVSDEEVNSLVLGSDPHPIVRQLFTNQQTGEFDQSFLVNFLKTTDYDPQANKYWMFFEDEIVKTKINSKLNNLIAKGLYVTSKQAEFEHMVNSNIVDFSFVMKPFSAVPDSSVTVTAADIEKYYNKHKEDFKQTASRDMEYVEFEVIPSNEDIAKDRNDILTLKDEFAKSETPVQYINLNSDVRDPGLYQKLDDIPDSLKAFVSSENTSEVYGPYEQDNSFRIARLIDVQSRPDSVHVRHILISPGQNETLDDVKVRADSIMNLIKTGSDFGVIASVASTDPGSAQLGGDLGWFQEGMMVTPFNDACFEGKKGDLTMVQTTYGYHIIEILDQSRRVKKYQVGVIVRNIVPSSSTYQNVYSEASRFAGMNNTYEKFNQAVADEGINKRVVTDITPDQKEIAGLESPRQLVMSLFEAEEGHIILDRSEQAVFELGDKFVIAYCTGVVKDGYAPVEDVENDIRFAVMKEKKGEKLVAEMGASVSGLSTIEDIASRLGLSVMEATNITFNSFSIPGAGIEPAVISAAAGSATSTITHPIEGNNGVFILAINDVRENTQNQTTDLIKSRLASTYEMRSSYEAFQALQKDMNIVDLRYKFY